ncbi:hypothetical protein HYT02_05040 [Candidatus Gottesmanbacteria bacterium]|nr:hypothetical protein [Candidatus Gottesmanbacteria bacterium]
MIFPLFPDSVKIKDKWHYRLAIVISIVIGVLSLFSIISFLLNAYFGNQANKLYSYSKSPVDQYLIGATIWIIIGLFAGNVIYRIFLFVIYGNKWHK